MLDIIKSTDKLFIQKDFKIERYCVYKNTGNPVQRIK